MSRFSMFNVNKVTLTGRLTQDPELRYTPQGTAVTTLRLAMNRTYTTANGEKKDETTYVNVDVWQKQAETCAEYLGKGRAVFVEGRLRTHAWETQDGQKRSALEVVASRVQFMDWPETGGAKPAETGEAPPEPQESPEPQEDDIPF